MQVYERFIPRCSHACIHIASTGLQGVANTLLAAYLALMSSSFLQIILTDLHIDSRSEFLIFAHFIKAAASYDSRSYDDDCGMTFFS